MKWQELAADSHYKTAVAVNDALAEGNVIEAKAGIEELIDALSRSERRAIRSHLIRLMAHVIKWHTQPERRTRSWRATIVNARNEIIEIQEETPSLNRAAVEVIWTKCFKAAREEAEGDMGRDSAIDALSWEQVFVAEYTLPHYGANREDEE